MILESRRPLKLNPRADFRPEEFRKRIISHGMDLVWQQAAECPCTSASGSYGFTLTGVASTASEQNRPDCAACHGRGYIYHSSQQIRAVVTGVRGDPERFGPNSVEYNKGQIGITLLPEHLPALGDRFTISSSAIVYRETLVRSANPTDAPRYKIATREHDLANGALSFGVRYLIAANAQGIVDPTTALAEGVDFQVTNGEVEWINPATTPAQGQRFSLEYYIHPSYIVTSHPHAVRDSQLAFKAPAPYHIELPVYAEATLEFYGPPEGVTP